MDERNKELQRIEFLANMADKYIWWKTTDEVLGSPQRVLAQIMNIGTWNDTCVLVQLFSSKELKEVLENASAGYFRARSWHFWCYRLIGKVLPMPIRGYLRENIQTES